MDGSGLVRDTLPIYNNCYFDWLSRSFMASTFIELFIRWRYVAVSNRLALVLMAPVPFQRCPIDRNSFEIDSTGFSSVPHGFVGFIHGFIHWPRWSSFQFQRCPIALNDLAQSTRTHRSFSFVRYWWIIEFDSLSLQPLCPSVPALPSRSKSLGPSSLGTRRFNSIHQ